MSKPHVVAFIQARLTSTRLPNKVLAKVGQWTALELMLKRLERADSLDKIVILIPDTKENDPLATYITENLKISFYRGSEHDVLGRFADASKIYPADYYMRLTADCPLICPEIINRVIELTISSHCDYGSNVDPPTFPDGFDTEMISKSALQWLHQNATDQRCREHVTLGIREMTKARNLFNSVNLRHDGESAAWMRITLDTPEDLNYFQQMAEDYGPNLSMISAEEIERDYKSKFRTYAKV